MNRKIKMLMIFVIILTILILAEIMIINTASDAEAQIQAICAAADINKGDTITENSLIIKKIPLSFAANALTGSPEKHYGKKASCFLHKGEILYNENFALQSNKTEEGKVMMSFDAKGVQANGWWLEEDSTVDMMVVFNGDEKNIRIIQDIRVAALLDEAGNKLQSDSNNKRTVPPSYISVEVTEVQALLLAAVKGSDRIVLAVK